MLPSFKALILVIFGAPDSYANDSLLLQDPHIPTHAIYTDDADLNYTDILWSSKTYMHKFMHPIGSLDLGHYGQEQV